MPNSSKRAGKRLNNRGTGANIGIKGFLTKKREEDVELRDAKLEALRAKYAKREKERKNA